MKLSKTSKNLMTFLNKNKHLYYDPPNKKTIKILRKMYNDLYQGYQYVAQNNSPYYLKTKQITSVLEISKPKKFSSSSFPEKVHQHIENFSASEFLYTFSLQGRKCKVYFISEQTNIPNQTRLYNSYIERIQIWLYILNKYASIKCSNTLSIYIYLTSLEKMLPESNQIILDELNINTAFTTTCPVDSEIIIFRKEEWFKVLIHETFHNFALDFSGLNVDDAHKCILQIFKVKSEVRLYEAYTEFWAEIINACFCGFYSLNNKHDIEGFIDSADFFINFERTYSFLQLEKILDFMGLSYKELYDNNSNSQLAREKFYREKTHVLSYYVIKTVLMNSYQSFLDWCEQHNSSLYDFKKTQENQKQFCKFIEKNYRSKSMLDSLYETHKFLNKLKNVAHPNRKHYILINLRMSICELG